MFDIQGHVRAYLQRLAALFEQQDLEAISTLDAEIEAHEAATTETLPLLALDLSLAARHALIAAAAPMLDPSSPIVAAIAGGIPTVDELIETLAFGDSDVAVLRDAIAELAAKELVDITAAGLVATDPRVISHLRGDATPDVRLRGLARLETGNVREPDGAAVIAHVLATPGPILVEGPAMVGKTTAAIAAAERLGRPALVLDIDALAAATEPATLLVAARREAMLQRAVLVLDLTAFPGERWSLELRRGLLLAIAQPLVVTTIRDGEPLARELRGPRRVRIGMPTAEQQVQLWRDALGDLPAIESVVSRYPLPAGDVLAAAAAARVAADMSGQPITEADLNAAARARLSHRMGEVAELVTTSLAWDDLVLRPDVEIRLREIVSAIRHKSRVMSDWGFADKLPYGRSISALFSGAPGTGKTMVATLIAKELGLEVFRVDLSKIVSKYIGETERNIDRVFSEASRCRAVVLFDECDSLFAKRTEVKSSNDRYANLEVNFLLQRLEAHDGIVILTTNAATAIDPAFLRRLRYRIEFPTPDDAERALLWRAMVPKAAPLAADVDFESLAKRFKISGGHIKNAVVRAAFLAADAELPAMTQTIFERAATLEWTELGNLPEVVEAPAPLIIRSTARPRAKGTTLTDVAPPPAAPVAVAPVSISLERDIAKVMDRAPGPGETVAIAFARKESDLCGLFARLSVPEARALHRRLTMPGGDDALAQRFARMAADRRGRLIEFLGDARRRAAVAAAS